MHYANPKAIRLKSSISYGGLVNESRKIKICTTNMVDELAVARTWITVSVQLHPFYFRLDSVSDYQIL